MLPIDGIIWCHYYLGKKSSKINSKLEKNYLLKSTCSIEKKESWYASINLIAKQRFTLLKYYCLAKRC